MRYESWVRRKKLRRIFNEESAHKSQFYAIWALNNFSILVNRVQQNSPQGRTNFVNRFNSSDNLDPQLFFFDKAKILLLPIEDQGDDNLKNEKTNQSSYNSNTLSLRSKKAIVKVNKLTNMGDDSKMILRSNQMDADLNASLVDDLSGVRDTSEIIAMMLAGMEYIEPKDEFKSISFIGDLAVTQEPASNNIKTSTSALTVGEYTELTHRVFDKFKHASVRENLDATNCHYRPIISQNSHSKGHRPPWKAMDSASERFQANVQLHELPTAQLERHIN